ncbi:MAG: ATP-binding cassette domain-containing protein, partial [Methanospirillum sp.]
MEFDGKRALSNITFEIHEGEIMGIIGRSGAGKTVLMHLLRGVDQPPTSGQVIYHVARCAGCGRVELPSRAGQSCPCGGTYGPIDVDLWAADDRLKREVMARTAIMFQRTFALYG